MFGEKIVAAVNKDSAFHTTAKKVVALDQDQTSSHIINQITKDLFFSMPFSNTVMSLSSSLPS